MELLPPAADDRSRVVIVRDWLIGSLPGRLLVAGAACKIGARLGLLSGAIPQLFSVVDTLGGVLLVAAAVLIGYRLYTIARRRLLWRVRRKLILSYVFIGLVPLLLVVSFFLLSGLLFFFNVSAFMLRTHMDALVAASRFLADAAVPLAARAPSAAALRDALGPRQAAADARYPQVSYALVPGDGRCAPAPAGAAPAATVGPWAHLPAPAAIPAWLPCTGMANLITYRSGGRTLVAARAVSWLPDGRAALVVDIPFGEALVRAFHDETGITVAEYTRVEPAEPESGAGAAAPTARRVRVGPVDLSTDDRQEPLGWVAFLDYTDWTTGEQDTMSAGFRMGPAAVFRYLSGPSFERLNNVSVGQLILLLLGVVGGLLLVIQGVAVVMGLALARSITGSVHELFTGTERVRLGDFSHKIAIRSRDQLGELAASFNSMTASIEDLLQEKAEKERLEQELRIARSIQMSLLPQGPLRIPGVALAGHCEPAREVGGDYYDFLPLDEDRLGVLIADVSGKGTSAALYMAELKGLVLSLSRQHQSPRQLLVDANHIISKHLDARSFITMTYLVVDLRARTLTFARAGHCPLVYVPGPGAVSRAPQVLTPDGMVLGLQLDAGETFARLLEEVTLPFYEGDMVLLYTDGISEAMNVQGDCFGDTRLVELAERHADLSSDDVREQILREVHTFAGDADQHDDMTMVLVKIEAL